MRHNEHSQIRYLAGFFVEVPCDILPDIYAQGFTCFDPEVIDI